MYYTKSNEDCVTWVDYVPRLWRGVLVYVIYVQ